MTKEEAINKAIQNFEWAIYADNRSDISLLDMQIAIAALREQEERSKGCEFCKGAKYIYGELSSYGHVDDDHGFVNEWYGDLNTCPMCGRRLED